ncbi:MarR family winged helix-turn-helix transcriptional regulator [Frondihabitans peucedani]|uniref:HTH marR-type domain-containing protein n=1 Tax=Frondihabitans peucedani TaxID=598626 RepID=A0ABP8E1K8_9MICO
MSTGSTSTPTATAVAVPDEVSMKHLLVSFARLQGQNHRLTARLARRHRIGETDLRTLLILRILGGTTLGHLGRLLDQTAGSITPLVDRLEKAGLAAREAHPTDRRRVNVALTAKGGAAVEDAWNVYRRIFARVVAPDEVQRLAGIFLELSASIEEDAA